MNNIELKVSTATNRVADKHKKYLTENGLTLRSCFDVIFFKPTPELHEHYSFRPIVNLPEEIRNDLMAEFNSISVD